MAGTGDEPASSVSRRPPPLEVEQPKFIGAPSTPTPLSRHCTQRRKSQEGMYTLDWREWLSTSKDCQMPGLQLADGSSPWPGGYSFVIKTKNVRGLPRGGLTAAGCLQKANAWKNEGASLVSTGLVVLHSPLTLEATTSVSRAGPDKNRNSTVALILNCPGE